MVVEVAGIAMVVVVFLLLLVVGGGFLFVCLFVCLFDVLLISNSWIA